MNSKASVLVVFLLAGHASALLVSVSPNDYIDTVLRSSLQYDANNSGLDPLRVPDVLTFLEDRVSLIGKVRVRVNYTDGQLTGLSGARRNATCGGPFYTISAAFLNCSIVFDKLHLTYDGVLKYGKLPEVSLKAEATMNATVINIGVINQPYNKPFLTFFNFQQIGGVDTKFSGLGAPLNKHVKLMDPRFRSQAWGVFFRSIGEQFQFSLSRAINIVPIPWN